MRRTDVAIVLFAVLLLSTTVTARQGDVRRLPVDDYVDKMTAGWIGQMVGVAVGGPTEFGWMGAIIPQDSLPKWKPRMVNQFEQDDLYVEMTFLRTLELYGLDVSIRQAGIDFANSGYMLWHANRYGRENLRNGIAPPDSGHPKFNAHSDDIDYQIEADFAGLISPGMPNRGIQLGEVFGRLMNYGDGVYGGQFVSGMYAEAFFQNDMEKVVRAGLRCIPKGSQYHECISDVLRWWAENPEDWEKTWKLIEDKYDRNPAYRLSSCDDRNGFNIDAKINGAYIAMGMLYGKRDLDKTIAISTRCGQDSDCNPSSAAGVLFTSVGFSNLPDRFTSGLDEQGKFSHTPYTFPILVHVCETLARQAVLNEGGRVERDSEGREVFVIPVRDPKPSTLEQSRDPGPIGNSRFTERELAQIKPTSLDIAEDEEPADVPDMSEAMEKIAPGWMVKHCGGYMPSGLHEKLRGRERVLVTHPLSREVACVVFKRLDIPKGKTELCLTVGHHEEGDWTLIVKANGNELLNTTVGKETTEDGWRDIQVDLSEYAGKEVMLELLNGSNDWAWEAGYWANIAVVSE